MASPYLSRGYTAQKDAQIKIDDGFLEFFRVPIIKRKGFLREVERGMRRAAVAGANSVKDQIQVMNAVAFGFMRKSVTYSMKTKTDGEFLITGKIGTKAWYDILVHEGLGRHGGSRSVPSEYRPTAAQLAIVDPDWETRNKPENRARYWKPSPKTPRPFLTTGIKKAKNKMKSEVMSGIRKGLKTFKGKGKGTPRHDISALFLGGKF
jgi:hypothetical protein